MTGKSHCLQFFPFFPFYILCTFHVLLKENHAPFIKFIAISNGIYTLITTGLVIYHFTILTKLGVSYFVVETFVVSFVIALEWRLANQLSIEIASVSSFSTKD